MAFVRIEPDVTEEVWLSRFSKARRKDFRRKLRSRDGLVIRELRAGDAQFQSEELLSEWYTLYRAVFAQSEVQFDCLTPGFFRNLLQQESGAIVFVYEKADQVIGYNVCFVHDEMLIDKYIGLRYPEAHESYLYFVSWFHNLEYARRQGLRTYVAGWTDPEIKATLGASFSMTQHLVYVRPLWLRWMLRRLHFLFESDSQVI